jgi:hypothetical protein
MARPSIPQRIAPLSWRRPTFVWTPLALAVAIGWPAALFYQDGNPQRLTLVAGAAVFAIALSTLGVSWFFGRPPKSRRAVVVHVVAAMFIAALVAPFVLTQVLRAVADTRQDGAGHQLNMDMSMAMTPLALVVGLPIGLVSGILFAWIALTRPRADAHEIVGDFRRDVQPFR